MSRALPAAVFVAVALLATSAQARSVKCDEDGPVSLPVELLRTPAPAPLVTAGPALPVDDRVCIPGLGDDAGCWPQTPAAPAPHGGTTLFSHPFVTVVAALGRPPVGRLSLDRPQSSRLPPGHARRVDRPPRSV